MTNKSVISVENLRKTYPATKKGKRSNEENEALKGISIDIPQGSIFGLLGSNGAGKSTFINILAGLSLKTSGKITINGYDIDKDPRKTRYSIGVVPQEVALDPFFTVREMLEYYSGYYGVKKADRRTDELLEALSLTDKANVNSRHLSGGMKRRVLIAKALVHTPPILILDEPTAGVDVELRTLLWQYVKDMNNKGTTILLTTHYLEEAEELCDKIAIINHGKIIANDDTSTLINIMDEKQLTLHFTEEINFIPENLLSFDTKIVDRNSISINYKTSDITVAEFLELVKKSGLTIKDLSTKESDLEDIFRHLVSKEA